MRYHTEDVCLAAKQALRENDDEWYHNEISSLCPTARLDTQEKLSHSYFRLPLLEEVSEELSEQSREEGGDAEGELGSTGGRRCNRSGSHGTTARETCTSRGRGAVKRSGNGRRG